jgi:hypothetical protein
VPVGTSQTASKKFTVGGGGCEMAIEHLRETGKHLQFPAPPIECARHKRTFNLAPKRFTK